MTHHSLHKITGKIRKLRQDAGYKSHEDFALEVPMNRSSYNKLEGGAPNVWITKDRSLDPSGTCKFTLTKYGFQQLPLPK